MKLGSICRFGQRLLTQKTSLLRTSALAPCTQTVQRTFASDAPSNITVKLDDQRGVALVEMHKKPVNSLSLEFLTELSIALEKLENNKSCRGYILTSTVPAFCAGLDILEMYKPEEARLRTFWKTFQDVALRLHGTNLINIAAITGPAPAGGCAMSLACDYRIMTDNQKALIGLNESLLGITAPYWLRELAQYTIGDRKADLILQTGVLLSPKDALGIGLIDEIAPQAKVVEVAQQQMDKWLSVPDAGRQLTKAQVRNRFMSDFLSKRKEDEDAFVSLITKDGIQKLLGRYLEAMKQKAAKSK